MMKMQRPQQPDWLKENYKKWGKSYKRKRDNPNKKNDFVWVTFKGKKVNVELLQILRNSTDKHCAFCDDKIQKGTIEHFRPVSESPMLSYFWHNLFPCCHVCQEKNSDFDKNLLKPDRFDYEFRRYFIYNAFSGEINVNPKAKVIDRRKAEITIRIYKLNRKELIEDRLDCFDNYQNVADAKRPFRFIFAKRT